VYRIRIIVAGRTRAGFLKEGEALYLKRLRRYAQVDWIEVKPVRITKGRTIEEVLAIEGQSMAKKFLPREFKVALDSAGKAYDSEGFAKRLEKLFLENNQLTFLTGGPLGLHKDVLIGADEILSLSSLTFTHEISRLLLLEQLYRAFTIMQGERYHK
jgi:23S rRNA (pseudouridine1915-N3)-methyltransferase